MARFTHQIPLWRKSLTYFQKNRVIRRQLLHGAISQSSLIWWHKTVPACTVIQLEPEFSGCGCGLLQSLLYLDKGNKGSGNGIVNPTPMLAFWLQSNNFFHSHNYKQLCTQVHKPGDTSTDRNNSNFHKFQSRYPILRDKWWMSSKINKSKQNGGESV